MFLSSHFAHDARSRNLKPTCCIYRSVVPAELAQTVHWWGTRCLHRPLECDGFILANSLLLHSTAVWWYIVSLRCDFPSKSFYFSCLYNRKILDMERCAKHETCGNAAHLSIHGWFQRILFLSFQLTIFLAIKTRNLVSLTSTPSPIYQNTWTINLLAPELFFLILAQPVYKMWIIREPNTLELWNKLHF